MNKTEQAEQLRLAAEIIETGHPWEYWHIADQEWLKPEQDSTPQCYLRNPTYKIRLTLATPPDGRPLHNPDNLTAEQVGAGWRLLAVGEKLPEGYDFWHRDEWDKGYFPGKRVPEYESDSPCRVPLSVPWPEAPKPEPIFQLPPPPPGMQWHHEDGWKEGDLPQGYRPLIAGEWRKNEDEWTYDDGNGWRLVANYGPEAEVGRGAAKHRTTRPLVFTHEGKEWTWHRPGDPMPCDGERDVYCLVTKGDNIETGRTKGRYMAWSVTDETRYFWGVIIGWRYAEPETKTVPLGPEDVPPGSWISLDHEHLAAVIAVSKYGLSTMDTSRDWKRLMNEGLQINRSIPLTGKWDANAWEPCSKEVPA